MSGTPTKQFTVMGRGAFPFDMLRYDSCWPATLDDSAKIEAVSRGERSLTINLLTSDRNFSVPTSGRWASFNWKVVEGASS